MSVIRYEFVTLSQGLDRKSAEDYFISEVVGSGEVTATTTETVSGALVAAPPKAGYVILTGISGGDTFVGKGATPDATNKGKLVKQDASVILVLNKNDKLSFKSRA